MRLSDAGLRYWQSKLLYPNHRSPPGLTEDATPRSLQPIVRPILIRTRVATLHKIATQYRHQSVTKGQRNGK
jgi:hypothetical protein